MTTKISFIICTLFIICFAIFESKTISDQIIEQLETNAQNLKNGIRGYKPELLYKANYNITCYFVKYDSGVPSGTSELLTFEKVKQFLIAYDSDHNKTSLSEYKAKVNNGRVDYNYTMANIYPLENDNFIMAVIVYMVTGFIHGQPIYQTDVFNMIGYKQVRTSLVGYDNYLYRGGETNFVIPFLNEIGRKKQEIKDFYSQQANDPYLEATFSYYRIEGNYFNGCNPFMEDHPTQMIPY